MLCFVDNHARPALFPVETEEEWTEEGIKEVEGRNGRREGKLMLGCKIN